MDSVGEFCVGMLSGSWSFIYRSRLEGRVWTTKFDGHDAVLMESTLIERELHNKFLKHMARHILHLSHNKLLAHLQFFLIVPIFLSEQPKRRAYTDSRK